MIKLFVYPIYITVGVFFLALFGFLADFAGLIEYNVYKEVIQPYSPHSFIYTGVLFLFLYLILVLIGFIKLASNNTIFESDVAILNSMADAFPSNKMYAFKDYLEQSRAVYIDQIELFDISARKFLERNMNLSNKSVERSKKKFLMSLLDFIRYTDENFNPISHPNIVKFKAGTSEFEIMTNEEYAKEEKIYLNTAKKMYHGWIEFQETIRKVYPNYVWRE